MTGYAERERTQWPPSTAAKSITTCPNPKRTEDLAQILRNAAEKFELERSNDRLLVEWLREHSIETWKSVSPSRTRELQEANGQLEQQTEEVEAAWH